ncbi:hypothetical protein [Schaalia suimastitidis]|uniref:hypothetical protein n=1 Tax=Schaalia suimastitidis TaxID=121163 RepID=UPI000402643A|nr:hypothetical protein [Schaalia suimastitidis]
MQRPNFASPAFRSALFSLVFSPIALTLLGSAMADVLMRTATGQPLASVEGMIGMAMSAILIGLVSINCEDSVAGLVVATVISLPIAVLQFLGVLHIPGVFSMSTTADDLGASAVWNLHPVGIFAILLGSTLAVALKRSAVKRCVLRSDETSRAARLKHQRIRALVAVATVPLTLAAAFALASAAPKDSGLVAIEGLSGLFDPATFNPGLAAVAALCLGLVAFASRWSLFGPQVCAWAFLIFPFYLVLPLWATLSGSVVTPGTKSATAIALSAPILASWGLVLAAATLGVHWVRKAVARSISDNAPIADRSTAGTPDHSATGTPDCSTADTPDHDTEVSTTLG